MEKNSYKNSRPERLKFIDSLPCEPSKDSATENAGRAGWNLREMSRDINGIPPEEKVELFPESEIDVKPTVEFLTDLSDDLDQAGMETYADFIDFLLVKFATEDKKTYLQKFNELMIKVSATDIPDTNETIKKLTKIFSNTILLETSKGADKNAAYESAYKKTLNRAEQYLTSGKMIKQSQVSQNPIVIAQNIKKIIDTMVGKFSPEARHRAYPNLKNKIQAMNPEQIAAKKSAGGSAIGVSISLVKNILNGRDPMFVRMVINNLARILV